MMTRHNGGGQDRSQGAMSGMARPRPPVRPTPHAGQPVNASTGKMVLRVFVVAQPFNETACNRLTVQPLLRVMPAANSFCQSTVALCPYSPSSHARLARPASFRVTQGSPAPQAVRPRVSIRSLAAILQLRWRAPPCRGTDLGMAYSAAWPSRSPSSLPFSNGGSKFKHLFKIICGRQQGGLANFSLLRHFGHMRP